MVNAMYCPVRALDEGRARVVKVEFGPGTTSEQASAILVVRGEGFWKMSLDRNESHETRERNKTRSGLLTPRFGELQAEPNMSHRHQF